MAAAVRQIDRLAYTDGRGNRLGESAIHLACQVRGERPGATGRHGLADALPRLSDRLGLDANPIDPADAAAARWLRACVWPDQVDRSQRLEAALRLAASNPPRLMAGDAVSDLAAALDRLLRPGADRVRFPARRRARRPPTVRARS
mgnify:CR=1 FL=1